VPLDVWMLGLLQGRILGVLGEPHVNVLALNMALDAGEAG